MKRLDRFAVGNAALKLKDIHGKEMVAWGDIAFLDAIASEADLPSLHPLDRHKRVLDRLEHDTRFEKFLFRIWIGNREGLARAFRYKTEV